MRAASRGTSAACIPLAKTKIIITTMKVRNIIPPEFRAVGAHSVRPVLSCAEVRRPPPATKVAGARRATLRARNARERAIHRQVYDTAHSSPVIVDAERVAETGEAEPASGPEQRDDIETNLAIVQAMARQIAIGQLRQLLFFSMIYRFKPLACP